MARSAAFPRPALALVATCAFSMAPPAEAAFHQLSQVPDGNTLDESCTYGDCPPVFSPDGKWVVYLQDDFANTTRALWAAPTAGGDPLRLSPDSEFYFTFGGFAVSPDSSRVVYIMPSETSERQLYSARLDAEGSNWVRLYPEVVDFGPQALQFAFSPDNRLVFIGTQIPGLFTIRSVPIDGGPSIVLGQELAEGEEPWNLRIDTLRQRAVYSLYQGPQGPAARVGLWSAPLAGGAPMLLGEDLGEYASLDWCQLSTDLERAVCPTSHGIWSYRLDGGGGIQLGVDIQGVFYSYLLPISPDGAHVLLLVVLSIQGPSELWSMPITGGTSVKLNGPLVEGGSVGYGWISPDSRRVVYVADQEVDGVDEIWSVPIAGGAVTKLNPPLVAGGDVRDDSTYVEPFFSADGSQVLYVADQEVDGTYELWSVPAEGGPATRVSPPLTSGTSSSAGRLAADGDSVFIASWSHPLGAGYETAILHTPLDSPSPVELPGTAIEGWDLTGWTLASPVDPRQALVRARSPSPGATEQLFLADTCVLCDGFESGLTVRWSAVSP